MNELISGRVAARSRAGLIDRLRSAAPLDDDRQARFHRLHADYEGAIRRGDDMAAAVADHAIDKLLEESRAASVSSNVGQAPEPPAPNFSGGFRGRRYPVAPVRRMLPPPSSKEMFREAIRASKLENRGRPAQIVRIPGAQP